MVAILVKIILVPTFQLEKTKSSGLTTGDMIRLSRGMFYLRRVHVGTRWSVAMQKPAESAGSHCQQSSH